MKITFKRRYTLIFKYICDQSCFKYICDQFVIRNFRGTCLSVGMPKWSMIRERLGTPNQEQCLYSVATSREDCCVVLFFFQPFFTNRKERFLKVVCEAAQWLSPRLHTWYAQVPHRQFEEWSCGLFRLVLGVNGWI